MQVPVVLKDKCGDFKEDTQELGSCNFEVVQDIFLEVETSCF